MQLAHSLQQMQNVFCLQRLQQLNKATKNQRTYSAPEVRGICQFQFARSTLGRAPAFSYKQPRQARERSCLFGKLSAEHRGILVRCLPRFGPQPNPTRDLAEAPEENRDNHTTPIETTPPIAHYYCQKEQECQHQTTNGYPY